MMFPLHTIHLLTPRNDNFVQINGSMTGEFSYTTNVLDIRRFLSLFFISGPSDGGVVLENFATPFYLPVLNPNVYRFSENPY